MNRTGAVSTASDNISAELVERFRGSLARLNPERAKIGLAVSGGPDSMAMLLLAHEAIPGRFEVATVNHGLRSEAVEECALVVSACEERGIPCEVFEVEVAVGNLQAKAREARYAALAQWAEQRQLSAVATAHHANDQAETLLMRLNRGSGTTGLAGTRERAVATFGGRKICIIRPLLGMLRDDLGQIIETCGVSVVDDPSNHDEKFDRVRMRKALASSDWIDPVALSQSASHLAEAEEALTMLTNLLWHDHVERDGANYRLRNPQNIPRVIALRMAEWIVDAIGTKPRGSNVARLLDGLERGLGGNLGGVMATLEDGQWVFRREPPRKTG